MDQVTMAPEASLAQPSTRRSDFVIAVVGVVAIPAIVVLASNSWTAPALSDYIRMAFAQVAATTIACSTLVGLALAALMSGRRSAAAGWISAAALAGVLATSGIVNASAWLERAVS